MRTHVLNMLLCTDLALRNFWILASGPLLDRSELMAGEDVAHLRQIVDRHRERDEEGLRQRLIALVDRPVAIEFEEACGADNAPLDSTVERRLFRLPRAATVRLGTLSFDAGGFGGSVWGCSIALAIRLMREPQLVRGRRVLELGSGTGLAGIASAMAGARSVTLSDFGELAGEPAGRDAIGQRKSANLQANLRANADATRAHCAPELRMGEIRTAVLDWDECARPGYDPDGGLGRYATVLAADCIFYESQAAPLAATIAAHTAPGGECHLVSRPRQRGRLADGSYEGLTTLLGLLAASGELESNDMSLVSNDGCTELVFSRWRPAPAGEC